MSDASGGESFAEFEKRRWGQTAADYDLHYVALTDQTLELMLARSGTAASMDCLDLACGPGTLAARAAARGARVTAVDFAPEMIACARARHADTSIDFRVGDAECLELADASFDVVLMNFGLMHMARPEAVAREAARVLRPGGRLCFTVWAELQKSEASRIIAESMALAATSVEMPAGEPFYRFCDADENRRVLGAAGFDPATVRLEDVPLTWRFADADALYRLFASATTRSALVIAAQTNATRSVIRDAFVERVSAWVTPEGDFAIPHAAVLVTAVRAGRPDEPSHRASRTRPARAQQRRR